MSLLAVITARGGSKGVPRKNIKNFAGKPLIAWAIEEAKKSKYIDRLIVSTEDEEIRYVSQQFGADVPFLRPKELAEDHSESVDVLLHAIQMFPQYEWVMQLQPTSPFRSVIDIDSSFEFATKHKFESVIAITSAEKSPYWYFRKLENQRIERIIAGNFSSNRQDVEKAFIPCGTIFLFKKTWLIKNRKYIREDSVGFEIPRKRAFEIDSLDDWEYAEYLMKKIND